MQKTILAIFFSGLFISLLLAPTIIAVIDNSVDVSLLYSICEEEEENKENEKNKEFEIAISELDANIQGVIHLVEKESSYLIFQANSCPYVNLIYPPPKLQS